MTHGWTHTWLGGSYKCVCTCENNQDSGQGHGLGSHYLCRNDDKRECDNNPDTKRTPYLSTNGTTHVGQTDV